MKGSSPIAERRHPLPLPTPRLISSPSLSTPPSLSPPRGSSRRTRAPPSSTTSPHAEGCCLRGPRARSRTPRGCFLAEEEQQQD